MGMIIFENDPPYERLEAQSAQAIPTSDGVELQRRLGEREGFGRRGNEKQYTRQIVAHPIGVWMLGSERLFVDD